MKNRITKSVPFLVTSTGKAIGGLTLYAAEVQPKYIDAQGLELKLESLIASDSSYQQGKIELKGVRATLYALTASVRQFVYVARDVVKPHLGNTYSQDWEAFGLMGSMEVPRSVDDLLPLLHSIDGYYTAHPEHQNPLLQATAARADELQTALSAASNAVNHQLDVLSRLYRERDTAAIALQAALRLLLKELSIVFHPLDPRWISFGFKKPGAKQPPEAPEAVSITMIDTETAALKWEPTPRADSYRVRARALGADTEPVLIGSPRDPNFTMESLRMGSDIEVLISAANSGGESRMTRVLIKIEEEAVKAAVIDHPLPLQKEKGETILGDDKRGLSVGTRLHG